MSKGLPLIVSVAKGVEVQTPREMKILIEDMADRLGLAAVGIAAASPVDDLGHLKSAIASERIGGMAWLARDPGRRCDPASLLPGAKAVICCVLAYGEQGIEVFEARHPERSEGSPAIARFARGADYHEAVRKRLEILWAVVQERAPAARAKICVDTSPLLEKALAERAGLGWIGKHTILLHERLGSWFVLGEIVTDLELEPNAPGDNRCGDCTACIDACPTGALIAPHVLDARRCISYLTIEHKGPISAEMRPLIPAGTYGCDRCQEVCPYSESPRRGFRKSGGPWRRR